MTEWEAIGRQPRFVRVIQTVDGDVELLYWPWRFPPRVIGRPIHRPSDIWNPY